MRDILVTDVPLRPAGEQPCEYVERKGVGHPDTICDAVMDAASVALSHAYRNRVGRVLHHNLDKALLVAGQTHPAFGGGQVVSPMKLVVGDRAVTSCAGAKLPIDEILEATAEQWFRDNLRNVDPARHLTVQNEIKRGSQELVAIFDRGKKVANDTSAAVGYAPLSETEQLVLEAEHFLNSEAFKSQHPATGEDVKVMGYRSGRQLKMTVAMAFVDKFVTNDSSYFELKDTTCSVLSEHLQSKLQTIDSVEVQLNMLDQAGRGLDGMYMTVLGTSAEGGDGGQVGRGNNVRGVIHLNRPSTSEAAAGKNAICHVGKIYTWMSHTIAEKIYHAVDPVVEVYVWLCSQIGAPIGEPWSISARVSLEPYATVADIRQPVCEIIESELEDIDAFTDRLSRGESMPIAPTGKCR